MLALPESPDKNPAAPATPATTVPVVIAPSIAPIAPGAERNWPGDERNWPADDKPDDILVPTPLTPFDISSGALATVSTALLPNAFTPSTKLVTFSLTASIALSIPFLIEVVMPCFAPDSAVVC